MACICPHGKPFLPRVNIFVHAAKIFHDVGWEHFPNILFMWLKYFIKIPSYSQVHCSLAHCSLITHQLCCPRDVHNIMPKHDFHDYIHMITQSNRTHCSCHFDISAYKKGINNGSNFTTIIFL